MQDPHSLPGIDPEMAAAMLKIRSLIPEGRLDVTTADISDVRAQYLRERKYWNEDGPEMHKTKDLSVTGPHGDIPVRFYYPADAREASLLIFFHGGGFVYGNIESHDKICRWVAGRSGVVVAAVDYRLAPEFKFPTPLDEAVAVLDYVIAEAVALGIDPNHIAMGGDSAGASISLGTAIALKERGRANALKFLLLYYGSYGLGYDCPSALKYDDPVYGLSGERRRFYRSSYVATAAAHEDPRLKQLLADLTDLPSAFLGAAEMDPLCDNTPAMAKALSAAGIPNHAKIYPGVLHGFLHLTRMVEQSRAALNDGADALKAALS